MLRIIKERLRNTSGQANGVKVDDGIVRLIGEGAIKLLPLHTTPMRTSASLYHRHRFPVEIISHCVWLYFRFNLSFRDVENVSDARRGSHLRNRQRMVPQVRSDLC